jgi:hypothetical protein
MVNNNPINKPIEAATLNTSTAFAALGNGLRRKKTAREQKIKWIINEAG